MDLQRLHHAEWFGAEDAARAVAIDELLEQLGDEWQFEALTRVNELTVATFLHRSDVRFVLVPGASSRAGLRTNSVASTRHAKWPTTTGTEAARPHRSRFLPASAWCGPSSSRCGR